MIVGRDAERLAVTSMLDAPAGFLAVVVEGEAGIGKTTLFRAGVEEAARRSFRVLDCSPAGAEAALSLTALGDLFGEVGPDVLAALPAPQARALDVAMARADGDEPGGVPDVRTLSLACLGVLRALGAEGGVLLAIDDVQWLDASSAHVLRFVLRRLDGEPVRLLTCLRPGAGDPLEFDRMDPARLRRVGVGPVTLEELARIIRLRIDTPLSRPALARILETSGGNPFYALELARSLARSGTVAADFSSPLPVPASLRDVVSERLGAVSDSALELLLVLSALSRPTLAVLAQVAADREDLEAALAEVEAAGLVETAGRRLAFTHPLLSSTVYTTATPTARRAVHRRLSTVVDDVEERARHLALAADGPEATVAVQLEEAARAASRRGAPAGAAQLLDQAVALTPAEQTDDRRRRVLEAARQHFDAGDAPAAKRLLAGAVDEAPSARARAEARRRLAGVLRSTDGPHAAAEAYRQALGDAESAGDVVLQASIHEALAWTSCWLGSVPGTHRHATRALRLLEEADAPDEVVVMAVLAAVAEGQFHMGMDESTATMERALEIEERHRHALPIGDRPSALRASHQARADEFGLARDTFKALYEESVVNGDVGSRWEPLAFLAQMEIYAGNFEQASALWEESYECAVQAGLESAQAALLGWRSLLHALEGHVDAARADAETALAFADRHANVWMATRALGHRGFVEVCLGDHAAALPWLERAFDRMVSTGVAEPGSFHFVPDLVESLVTLGDLGRADDVLAQLEVQATARRRMWALAAAARCRGLLLAARGDTDDAVTAVGRSLELFSGIEYPIDTGRSLLVLGALHRRRKHKRLAREALERALAIFEPRGATLWADRARAELDRVGGRAPSPFDLTETERRIAELAGEGLTNREVADRLFLSPRTVEANLSKVYRKLHVRSRTELAHRLADR